ncbi:MAG TPA: glycoside hydrolase family 43 protein [Polyangiaceae bacterium]
MSIESDRMTVQYRGVCAAVAAATLFASLPARADYPIASHRYLADPASLVHDGRIYLYCSNDDDNVGDDGYKMASIVAVSSSDLKNWTDHGEVLRVPRDASWANMSWAPAVIERDGTIFMYFGNNANGIGVASSTAPTGPFTDARGSVLVNASTPGASGTDSWLFDPGVFVDDDGQAYLYFGGNGESNARVIRLNEDMISVSGSAIALPVPYFFEASWMHKRGDTYYFSYSTNPDNGLRIDYMTSTSPTSGFTRRGTVGPQPPSNENNNHASIFEFEGAWYHAYHNRLVSTQAGEPTTYRRNIALETLSYADDGTLREVVYTTDGLPQLAPVNPYARVEAETFNAQDGVETEPCSDGGMNLSNLQDGDWIRVRGVDFGSAGARSFRARVASAASGGSLELHLDEPDGTLVGTCAVTGTGDWQTWADVTCEVSGASGVKDLYLTFEGEGERLFNVDFWQFTAVDGGSGGAGGGGAGGSAGGESGGSAGTSGGMSGLGGTPGGGAGAGAASGASSIAGASGQGAGGTSGGNTASGGSAGTTAGNPGSGGVPSNGGAPRGGAAGSAGSAAPPSESSSDDAGCGCRTAGQSSSQPWLAGLVLAAAWAAGLRARSRPARGNDRRRAS